MSKVTVPELALYVVDRAMLAAKSLGRMFQASLVSEMAPLADRYLSVSESSRRAVTRHRNASDPYPRAQASEVRISRTC